MVHERATERGTFDPHTIPGWYLGPAMHHYRCYRVWIPETSSVCVTDNVTWLPHNTPLPTATTEDLIIASANDLMSALLHQKPTDLLPPLHTEMRKALLHLSTIFANQVHPTDAHLISTPIPEQPARCKDIAQVPRVQKQQDKTQLKSAQPTPKTPPVKTSTYLQHNSTRWRLRRKNKSPLSTLNMNSDLKKTIAENINMTIEPATGTSPHKHNRLNAVLDSESGKLLEYHHLLKTKHKEIWSNACSKEFARLCQGRAQHNTPFTNTFFFLAPHEFPPGKKPTYLRICADIPPTKERPIPHQVHHRGESHQVQWSNVHTDSRFNNREVTVQQCNLRPWLTILHYGTRIRSP